MQPQPERLGGPDETRAATPKIPSSAPASSTPLTNGSVSRTIPHSLSSKPDGTQIANSSLPSQPPRPGTKAAEHTGSSEVSQPPREGLSGREVAFVEPEKQLESSGSTHATATVWAGAPQDIESKQHAPEADAMEVDEAPNPLGDPLRLTSLRPPPLDASRPLDILSSPGSTAQTATTPAVHDASPDTSPDNEGPHYPGDEDELGDQKPDQDHSAIRGAGQGVEGTTIGETLDAGAAQAASAQLLQESANATRSHGPSGPSTPRSPADQISDTQVSQPAATSLPNADTEAVQSHSSPHALSRGTEAPAQVAQQADQNEGLKDTQQAPSISNKVDAGAQMNTEVQTPIEAVHESIPGASISIPPSDAEANTNKDDQETPISQRRSSTPVEETTLCDSRHDLEQQDQVVLSSMLRKRSLAAKRNFKHKRNATVVFEKRPKKTDETIVASQTQARPYRIPTDDYFVPLFFDGFTRQSNWMKSPEQLLGNTHKTLSSSDCQIVLQENQACKVLRRIYHLQQNEKWSLRQPKRCPEPPRQSTTWDTLLQEMAWMRSDFREERKWKRAVARNLAEACAEWVASSDEERKYLQVKATIPPRTESDLSAEDSIHPPEDDSLPTPMPDLIPSDDADSPMDVDEEPHEWNVETIAPSAIFALQDDEVIFPLQRTAASDQLLDELPLYGAPLKIPKGDLAVPEFDPDAHWRRPALPLSKYVEGELVLKPAGPRLRQSRFKYIVEDEEDDFEVAGSSSSDEKISSLGPENTNVALFRPEMKAIRDRLHAGHQFRPPTESLMPSQSFYENRLASAWTALEDEELRRQVREYSYNWSLISKNISSNSLFISAEDRRTPWECFERWVQLEGFPNDVARTQYFQTYQRRIDSAQRAIAQANENARPQVGANGAVTPVQRRRPTLPIRVDRKPHRRHFATIDAMKKLAKKREATVAKQQQTANNQNRRTSTENPQQKLPTKTPEDYSRLRHEREKQMHEKLMRFTQQQQEAQRQVCIPRQQAKI